MKKQIYIETTVVSYFTARPSRDIIVAGHQESTRNFWPDLTGKYETYISAIVYEEARKGDQDQAKLRLAAIEAFPMLDIDEEARFLAERIIADRAIPADYPEDARLGRPMAIATAEASMATVLSSVGNGARSQAAAVLLPNEMPGVACQPIIKMLSHTQCLPSSSFLNS